MPGGFGGSFEKILFWCGYKPVSIDARLGQQRLDVSYPRV
jgi:hypothetical protein